MLIWHAYDTDINWGIYGEGKKTYEIYDLIKSTNTQMEKFIEDYEKTNGKAPTTKELTDKFSSLLG